MKEKTRRRRTRRVKSVILALQINSIVKNHHRYHLWVVVINEHEKVLLLLHFPLRIFAITHLYAVVRQSLLVMLVVVGIFFVGFVGGGVL